MTRRDAPVLALVLAVAYGLKHYYSQASAEDLAWILAPTAALVERFTGVHFAAERGAGFVSETRDLVIAPACAGINFLVIALLSTAFAFVRRFEGLGRKGLFLGASAALCYATTLLVNATRISLGMVFKARLGGFGPVSHADVHRVLGVATYLTSLWVLFAIAATTVRRFSR